MMGSGILGTGIPTFLLDVLPVLALAALAVSFLRERHRCREEEKALRETIRELEECGETGKEAGDES